MTEERAESAIKWQEGPIHTAPDTKLRSIALGERNQTQTVALVYDDVDSPSGTGTSTETGRELVVSGKEGDLVGTGFLWGDNSVFDLDRTESCTFKQGGGVAWAS